MSFVRVPPDGAGKRIEHSASLDLAYSGGTTAFTEGDLVVGAVSGLIGRVIHVDGNTASGILGIQLSADSPVDQASVGEALEVASVGYANAAAPGTAIYAQATTQVGSNNHHHGQFVDAQGAAYVRFSEGAPSLDARNNTRVAQSVPIGYYDYTTDPQDDLFWDDISGSGAVSYESSASTVLLSVGTASGSRARRTSNRYHFYQPGISALIEMALICGDTGKANNKRGWGYGDSENGLFWELSGQDVGFIVRSSTSGSPVDIRIEQADFNLDKLDGTGTSGFDLDVSKRNVYWFDFMWFGSGQIRIGVLGHNGERIVAHHVDNTNSPVAAPFMQTGSLPIQHYNINTGVTASTSELRSICSTVLSQSEPRYVFWRLADMERVTPKEVTTETPVLAMRAKLTVNGKPNRVNAYPQTISVFVSGGDVKMMCYDGGTLTGDTFAIDGGGVLEGDLAANALTADPSDRLFSEYLSAGAHNIDVAKYFELTDEGIMLGADGVTQQPFTFAFTKLSGTTVTVAMTVTYRELS